MRQLILKKITNLFNSTDKGPNSETLLRILLSFLNSAKVYLLRAERRYYHEEYILDQSALALEI